MSTAEQEDGVINVTFIHKWGPYNAEETAGFTKEGAERLITDKIAKPFGGAPVVVKAGTSLKSVEALATKGRAAYEEQQAEEDAAGIVAEAKAELAAEAKDKARAKAVAAAKVEILKGRGEKPVK